MGLPIVVVAALAAPIILDEELRKKYTDKAKKITKPILDKVDEWIFPFKNVSKIVNDEKDIY